MLLETGLLGLVPRAPCAMDRAALPGGCGSFEERLGGGLEPPS